MSRIIIHKSKVHWRDDKAPAPYRTVLCEEDEYHMDIVKTNWKGVTCQKCINFDGGRKLQQAMRQRRRKGLYRRNKNTNQFERIQ